MKVRNIYDYLEKSAERFPSRPAVSYKGTTISYKKLAESSNRMALSLCAKGVGKGDRVGIYLNKSIELLIAVYTTLKIGAVYVPIDSLNPPKRIEHIFSDCDISCLITNQKRLDYITRILNPESLPKLIVLTEAEDGIKNNAQWRNKVLLWKEGLEVDSETSSIVSPGNSDLAYILYTSGSTGQPKGVMLSHGNAIAFVNWAGKHFQVTELDRLANHAPLHFDISVFDLYVTAKTGGTVFLVPEEYLGLGSSLVDFIVHNNITIWYSVPSVLIRILTSVKAKSLRFSNLRSVLFAGEVFPMKYLRQLHELLPGTEMYNLYGPTETNVCTYYKVQETDLIPERKDTVPIGKPCEYAEVYAVTNQERLAESEEEGELYVSSPTVMMGYWGLPEKNSDVLVNRPSLFHRDIFFYRTGDLVRQDKSGNFIFIGRCDSMIKSRGYRIELGEIEAVMVSHPEVDEVAAVPIPDEVTGNRVIVYVVINPLSELNEQELMYYCSQYLPRYMVPERIVSVTELPRTSTGKVNRQELQKIWLKRKY